MVRSNFWKATAISPLADDDVAYHPRFLKRIVSAQACRPDCAFSYYIYRADGLTLGQGCDGFRFHSPQLSSIRKFADQHVVGTTLLYHDDVWISFFLFAKGIRVRAVPTPIDGETVYKQFVPNDGLSSLTAGNLDRDRIVTDNLPRLIRRRGLNFGRRMALALCRNQDPVRA